MGNSHDRILLVEHDPLICDLLGRQALQSIGYQIQLVGDSSRALALVSKYQPDLMIVDLNLPGLSGKDLLIAMRTQGIETPVLVITARGLENEAIQAFRLGASDSISWPAREAEIVAAVERVLKQVHENRQRIQLAQKLHCFNQELQNRVRELTEVFAAGKAILSLEDPENLNERILDWAVKISSADLGWFLLRDNPAAKFCLAAAKNLPVEVKRGAAWDDDMSTLVGLTGETLSAYAETLRKFKASSMGQSAAVVPIKIQKTVIGVLGIARKTPRMFSDSELAMVRAVAEYSSQALVNIRLLRIYDDRARSLQRVAETAQAGEKTKAEILLKAAQELKYLNESALSCIKQVLDSAPANLPGATRQALVSAQEKTAQAARVIDVVAPLAQSNLSNQAPLINPVDVARQVLPRFQRLAQQQGISLASELPAEPVLVLVDPAQLYQILEGLLANAVSVSLPGGKVLLQLAASREKQAQFCVQDSGPGIKARDLPHVFDRFAAKDDCSPNRMPAGGIGLPLIKELVSAYGGSIWVESKLGQGSIYHFTLPAAS